MTWKLSAAALVIVFLGCKEKLPEQVPVKGKVQYEGGKPIVEMILAFHPQDETNKNTRPEQVTDKEGKFSLTCAKGRYKITLAAPLKGPAGGYAGGPSSFVPGPVLGQKANDIYRDPQQTPWLIEVPENGKDNIILIVKAP